MPDRGTDNLNNGGGRPDTVIFVHAARSQPVRAGWIDQLCGTGMQVFSHREMAGCEATKNSYEQLGALLGELAGKAPAGSSVLILHADLRPDVRLLLQLPEDSSAPMARTVLSNASPEFNPFAGLTGKAIAEGERIAAAVDLLGSGQKHHHSSWPGHLVALSSEAVAVLSDTAVNPSNALARLQQEGGQLSLSDRDFAYAPGVSLFNSARLEPHEAERPPSWGDLSARLQAWIDSGCPDFGNFPGDTRPATLHVTHSWGGGVALWTRTFIESDAASRQLQLRSEGPQAGQGCGQRLCLYAGNQLDCPLGEWWLQPPIRSIEDANRQYREVLDSVCARHGIGRVIVSSLVGHSLDALRTRLPTLQVLHDHFPVWPFLSAHPGKYEGPDGRPDIAAASADRRLAKEFPDLSPESWAAMGDRYLSTVLQEDVRLAAPSQSAIDLRRQLDPRWNEAEIALIPHGFPPLDTSGRISARPRSDGRLRLVIPGRIQPGKGQRLLLEALPLLQPFAQVYLLGTGKSGEAFFGIPGVNVVIDYERDELPLLCEQIGPHIAALLSIVPETFSYTLSELQYLGIPVIATRAGSFPERIDDGDTGWLIEPTANALAEKVSWLAGQPENLRKARKMLEKLQQTGLEEMVGAYERLCTPALGEGRQPEGNSGLQRTQSAAMAFLKIRERVARVRAEEEAKKHTEWALDTQRALKEEQERRERWVGLLQQQVDERTAQLTEAFADLDETRRALEHSDTHLRQVSGDLEHLQRVHDQVLSSSSWKITRPLRVLRRTFRNFMQNKAWNPVRWPLLASALLRNLSTLGWRSTLMRMQFSGHESAPDHLPIDKVESVGDPTPPASLPRAVKPLVSIVIPAYNNWPYTAACLRSIAEARGIQSFEVIVVDDESSDETGERLKGVDGIRCLRNPANLGFIGSCNRGARAAKGKYLVLLNNDTQVLDGWIDALLATFGHYPEAGLVGSRLIYADGSLQECGGMIFEDGSGWNYGRDDDPDRPEYLHTREADYCSGACIMVETDLFNRIGGFDERYRPAYYEDTDLAFRIREMGRSVLVQPASTVIHHEGITSGTDTDSGIKRHQVSNQEKFFERWKPELANHPSRIDDPTNPAVIRNARDHRLRGRVLVIDATTPEPDQDSGSLRLSHLMRCFRGLGFGVTFFADNHGHAGRYTRDLQQMGIEVLYQPWIESNHSFFRQRGAEFDYVLVSRHYIATKYVALARKFCPRAAFIFDTVDLHYLREQRLADLEDSLPLRRVAEQTRRSELGVIGQSDAVLVVSETEVEVLKEEAPDARVHVLSNIHDVPGRSVGFEDRQDLFFVGGYQHPPNVDAARWFVNGIWPLIRAELPDASFHLIGSKAPDSVRSLKGDGVVFHGFVEDLEHYLDHCRLAVAPLRYGAGVKGKVNMSMAHGQPVVATPMAIEGIHAEHGRDVLVAKSEEDFANEVARLYRDEALWNELSDAAVRNVQTHFSVQAATRSIEQLIARLDKA